MFGLGMSEIIFLAVLALIVIGPKELPTLARTLGRFLNELKRSSNMLGDELKQHTRIDGLGMDKSFHSFADEEPPRHNSKPKTEAAPEQLSFADPIEVAPEEEKKESKPT